MQPVVYNVAVSIDGFIAERNGAIDRFLHAGDHVQDYLASVSTYSVAIMGRRTYQLGLDHGVTDPYPMLDTYVFSRSLVGSPNPRVHVVSVDLETVVRRLREQSGNGVYLVGGSEVAAQLLAARLIDEVILKVNPIVLGEGIPLFSFGTFAGCELVSSKVHISGVVVSRYRLNAA